MASFSSIFNIFRSHDASVLGIDIGTSSIKIVQLKKRGGKAILETYGEIALGPYASIEVGRATNLSTDQVSQALTDLLRESRSTTTKCGVSIPVGSSLITVLEIPTDDPDQIAKIVPLEARKYIPVPLSEIMLDWTIIPTETPTITLADPLIRRKTDVLTVAIHNETISRYKEILEKAHLDAGFIEIEIFSAIRAILEPGIGTVMVFDMGASSTKLYIVERGVVRSSHTINRGSQDITTAISTALGVSIAQAESMKRIVGTLTPEQEKNMNDTIALSLDYVFHETNRTLANFEQKYNRHISKIILTGGGVGYGGLLPLAKARLETEVELGDPFSRVEFPAFLSDILKTTGPEFSVAIGVALRRLENE